MRSDTGPGRVFRDYELPDHENMPRRLSEQSQQFRASVGAQCPFLSDPERAVQKDLDIQEYTDPGRPSVVDLWHDLRAVSGEIRPDWDLSAPGLREAWDAGDLSPFHGWNRRAAASASAA